MLKEMIKDIKKATTKHWFINTINDEDYNFVSCKFEDGSETTYDYWLEDGKIIVEKR